MRNISEWLKETRKKRKVSVDYVVNELERFGLSFSPKTIYGYENGRSTPNPETLMALCSIYEIRDILTELGFESFEEFYDTDFEEENEQINLENMTALERKMLKTYLNIDSNIRGAVIEQFKAMFFEQFEKERTATGQQPLSDGAYKPIKEHSIAASDEGEWTDAKQRDKLDSVREAEEIQRKR